MGTGPEAHFQFRAGMGSGMIRNNARCQISDRMLRYLHYRVQQSHVLWASVSACLRGVEFVLRSTCPENRPCALDNGLNTIKSRFARDSEPVNPFQLLNIEQPIKIGRFEYFLDSGTAIEDIYGCTIST